MRKNIIQNKNTDYKIIAVDDEIGIIDSLSVFIKRAGYDFTGFTNPITAIEKIKNEHFDILILDFIMDNMHGDQVVEKIRKFNTDLYIILLTGHKDLAPPLETMKKLDIQAYCEKGDKFDQLLLLIESGVKSIKQLNTIKDINSRLEAAYIESIETLKSTVEAKDPYTRGHSDRVSAYSVLIGEKLNLKNSEIESLRIGGLFHDIGKIGIPDSILLKPGKLTDEEYNKIKEHPTIGANIISKISTFSHLIPIIKYHHERFDGKGYPDKLSSNNIPYLARITAIADTFDAMTSRRPYRDALVMQAVKDEIKKCGGTQFDPNLVPIFLEILEKDNDKILEIQDQFPIQ